MEFWKSNILRLNIFWQNIFWKFQSSITQKGVEKSIWCRKQKLSRIQFYIFYGPPNIFWGSKYFFIEMSNFQNAISQKGLIEKFWFQWEMVTLTCLQHIPLTKLPRLFSSHDCPSRQVWCVTGEKILPTDCLPWCIVYMD